MSKRNNLIGRRFARLTVVDYAGVNKRYRAQWLCACDCGRQKVVLGNALLQDNIKSCGCLQTENRRKSHLRKRYVRNDMTGQTFGRLSAISPNFNGRRNRWFCICQCGNRTIVSATHLMTSHTISCGCAKHEAAHSRFLTHGLSESAEFRTWAAMLTRCENANIKYFKHYGGRGITVCERWHKFENFYADMGPKPTPRHSIDRIDVNGHYEPSNCRWATPSEQAKNKRPREQLLSHSPI